MRIGVRKFFLLLLLFNTRLLSTSLSLSLSFRSVKINRFVFYSFLRFGYGWFYVTSKFQSFALVKLFVALTYFRGIRGVCHKIKLKFAKYVITFENSRHKFTIFGVKINTELMISFGFAVIHSNSLENSHISFVVFFRIVGKIIHFKLKFTHLNISLLLFSLAMTQTNCQNTMNFKI